MEDAGGYEERSVSDEPSDEASSSEKVSRAPTSSQMPMPDRLMKNNHEDGRAFNSHEDERTTRDKRSRNLEGCWYARE